MQKHEDGSVTLTKEELSELNKAYQALYEIANGGVSSIEDYFDDQKDVMKIRKWSAQLNGKKFRRSDWE
jgi:hypothetical protein